MNKNFEIFIQSQNCSNKTFNFVKMVSELNNEERKKIGKSIQRLRTMVGISQGKLAKLIGVSRQTIVNYEINGEFYKNGLKYHILYKIANALSAVSGLKITVEMFFSIWEFFIFMRLNSINRIMSIINSIQLKFDVITKFTKLQRATKYLRKFFLRYFYKFFILDCVRCLIKNLNFFARSNEKQKMFCSGVFLLE